VIAPPRTPPPRAPLPRLALAASLALAALPCAGARAQEPRPVRALVPDGPDGRTTPLVRVVREVSPTVVNISSDVEIRLRPPFDVLYGPRTTSSIGSGVIIDESGYIVTNGHVIKQVDAVVRVTLEDGRTLPADVVSVDVEHDLALIKVTPREPLPAAGFGSSADVMIGETVVAIGNPLGNENTVTHGIVSSTGRDVRLPSPDGRARPQPAHKDFIQTDAPINPGNSGGPMFNMLGEVIGINVAIEQGAQNIGFAIPSDRVRRSLVGSLLNPVRLHRVTTGLSIRGDETGRDVRLGPIAEDSPATRADLRPGDRLVEVEGRPIEWEFDLNLALVGARPGDEIAVVVERDGRRHATSLVLEAHQNPTDTSWRRTGLLVADHPRFYGVLVSRVNPAGPAARFPMRTGDLIDAIDDRQVDSTEDFHRIVATLTPGTWVDVHLFRSEPLGDGTTALRGYRGRLLVQ